METATPIYPSQCPCGHLYLEKYAWQQPQNDKGLIGFCYCVFCRNRENVYIPDPQPQEMNCE